MLGFFILFVLFLGACYWILSPLLQGGFRQNGFTPKPEDIIKELKNKKIGAYAAIRELEFDLSMGKLTEEDFQILREKYTREAAGYMKEIDNLESPPAISSKPAAKVTDKQNKQGVAASRSEKPTQRKHIYCTSCGAKAAVENRFCAACGSKLLKPRKNYHQEEN
jgi:ribosomal protein L37E